MKEDYTTHDLLSEYAEAAKKLRSSQRFRAETLRKIRYQAAMQPETLRGAASSPIDYDEPEQPVTVTLSAQEQKRKPKKRISVKQNIRSLSGIAASVVVLFGVGAFLYHKVSTPSKGASSGDTSHNTLPGTSQSSTNAESAAVSERAAYLFSEYQSAQKEIQTLFSDIQGQCINPLYAALNPPTPDSDTLLKHVQDLLIHYELQYNTLRTRLESAEEALNFCGEVILCEAYVVSDLSADTKADSTVKFSVVNGTDSDITLSSDCSLVAAGNNTPVSDKPLSLDRKTLTIPKNSAQTFELSGFSSEDFRQDAAYELTLYDVGFRLDESDSGRRTRRFVYTAETALRDQIETIFSTPDENRFEYGFSVNASAEKLMIDELQTYFMEHNDLKDLMVNYEPHYVFSSELFAFSLRSQEIGPTVRRIWLVEDDPQTFVEEVNGQYYMTQVSFGQPF